jgi:hypothetical protein
MVHRHYGLRTTKPHDPTQGSLAPHPGAADGFIRAIAIVMLVMGVTLYESATVTDTANTTTSAPSAIGRGGNTLGLNAGGRAANGAMWAPSQRWLS